MSDHLSFEQLKDKLYRAIKAKAVLAERSKQLAKQVDDARRREDQTDHLLNELLDRQRELNYMLHRANSAIHHIHEANAVLSTEFSELVKELPAPNAPDWEERVNKINDLFKKTGALADELQDEIFKRGLDEDMPKAEVKDVSETPAKHHTQAVDVEEDNQPAPEQQPIAAAAQAEEVNITEVESAVEQEVDVTAVEPDDNQIEQEQPDARSRLDKLFNRVDSNNEPTDTEVIEDTTPPARKPGVLSRIWQKILGGSRKNGSVEDEDALSKQEESSSHIEDVEQQVTGKKQLNAQAVEDQPDKYLLVDEPEPGLSEVLESAAEEMEAISIEITADPSDDEQSVQEYEPEKPQSMWSKWMMNIAEARKQRALEAIERHEKHKEMRRNRRMHSTGQDNHPQTTP